MKRSFEQAAWYALLAIFPLARDTTVTFITESGCRNACLQHNTGEFCFFTPTTAA